MARTRKTLEQLKQERRELDAKIRRMEQAEREAKLRGTVEAMQSLGFFDLTEAEILEKLKSIAPAKTGKTEKNAAQEQELKT